AWPPTVYRRRVMRTALVRRTARRGAAALPATTASPPLMKLRDSAYRPPEFVMGAHGSYSVMEGDCAPSSRSEITTVGFTDAREQAAPLGGHGPPGRRCQAATALERPLDGEGEQVRPLFDAGSQLLVHCGLRLDEAFQHRHERVVDRVRAQVGSEQPVLGEQLEVGMGCQAMSLLARTASRSGQLAEQLGIREEDRLEQGGGPDRGA